MYKLSKNAQKNRNFQNFKLVVPLNARDFWRAAVPLKINGFKNEGERETER